MPTMRTKKVVYNRSKLNTCMDYELACKGAQNASQLYSIAIE